jgi:hypothetical protein
LYSGYVGKLSFANVYRLATTIISMIENIDDMCW